MEGRASIQISLSMAAGMGREVGLGLGLHDTWQEFTFEGCWHLGLPFWISLGLRREALRDMAALFGTKPFGLMAYFLFPDSPQPMPLTGWRAAGEPSQIPGIDDEAYLLENSLRLLVLSRE